MKRNRVYSFLFAGILAFTFMSAEYAQAASSSPARPQLAFTDGDPKSAAVITGQSVNLSKIVPDGYVNEKIVVIQQGQNVPITGGITFPFTDSSSLGKVSVASNFSPRSGELITGDVDPYLNEESIYSIQAEYAALTAQGSVLESNINNKSGTQISTIICDDERAVTQYSTCTLTCTSAERKGAAPAFTLSDGTGVFEKFDEDAGGIVAVDSYSQEVGAPKEIKLVLKSKTGEELHFTMTTKLIYSEVTENMGKWNDAGIPVTDAAGNTTSKDPDNYVRMGTTFELSFSMPRSNELFLTVLTPQAAINKLEEQIRGCDGISDVSFMKLGTGDAMNYITQNFNLRVVSNQYNARFEVIWKWEPQYKIVNGLQVPLTDAEKEQSKDVVSPGNKGADWQQMTINPLEDDIGGTLTAAVTYVTTDGGSLETGTAAASLPVKNITVHGIGKPVDVTRVRTLTGTPDGPCETIFEGDDTKLPNNDTVKMDAYQDAIPNFSITAKGPYLYELQLDMGAKNGAAQYAKVAVNGDPDAVRLQTQTGSNQAVDYKPGAEIANPLFGQEGATPGKVKLLILAQRLPADSTQRTATLTITFHIPDRNGVPQESSRRFTLKVNGVDSTPSQNSALRSLDIRSVADGALPGVTETIDYPFSSETTSYTGPAGMIHLPYRSKGIYLSPVREDNRGSVPITVTMIDTDNNEVIGDPMELKSGEKTPFIEFPEVGKVVRFEVAVPSQDPRPQYATTYTLEIVRDRASDDASLRSMGIYFPDDQNLANNLIANFDPETLEYKIEIPYSTSRLRVRAELSDDRAEGPVITPELEGSSFTDTDKQWLNDLPEKFAQTADGILPLTFEVTSESRNKRIYTVLIRRQDPGTDATLKSLAAADAEDKTLTLEPAFRPDGDTYTLSVPYATSQIKLNLAPNDPNVNDIAVYSQAVQPENMLFSLSAGEIKPGAFTPGMDVLPLNDDAVSKIGYHAFFIVVKAENPAREYEKIYELRVQRAEPSSDAQLKALVLNDQNGGQLKTFAFHPDETFYTLKVPYETTGISFTPTANQPGAVIQLRDGSPLDDIVPTYIGSGMTSKTYTLEEAGVPKTFSLLVTAEDGKTQKTYTVEVTRDMPSTDARLKGLKVDNVDEFTPLFIASQTKYAARVTLGAPGVVITATPNHAAATIRINGNVVEGGKPSDLIELIDIKQEVEIEVTAQDGVTKQVYTVEFTNENLIERTSNADLKRLVVNYGQMTPNFQPAVTEYEVAATENTYSVSIIPQVADPLAEMQVFSGSREIGDYNGNYALALVDGENPVTVKVTSPDKTVTKEYSLTIYRNEEDELKNLTPLKAEDIDFENAGSTIVVMIDEYPRVAADVFTTLKEYPDKTIIFQGNDYSLSFKASDLTRVIPQTEIYDFRMSFTSPDADAIYSLLNAEPANGDILDRTVMLYFYYHGSLPGPATFNLSLGDKYASQPLYWHYHNRERTRIDYYGVLNSNARGNIAVRIDHFSTYLLTPAHRIAGSQDKSGAIDMLTGQPGKENPQTGAQGGRS